MPRYYATRYRPPRRVVGLALFVAVAVAVAIWFDRAYPPRRPRLLEAPITLTGTARVVDGDSIRLRGEEVRLRGIDAPELHQTCRRGAETVACGVDARRALASLLAAGTVRCEASERDRFDRLLARCLAGGQDIGEAMIRLGQAVSFGAYGEVEAEARRARRGLWALEFERPADWRAGHPRYDP